MTVLLRTRLDIRVSMMIPVSGPDLDGPREAGLECRHACGACYHHKTFNASGDNRPINCNVRSAYMPSSSDEDRTGNGNVVQGGS